MNLTSATGVTEQPESDARGSLQRLVREQLCMVINDQEMCELPATWRVKSDKHMFDMYVCGSHALAFLGMKSCKVTPLSNDQAQRPSD